jgi:spoIIIJ-associated protein
MTTREFDGRDVDEALAAAAAALERPASTLDFELVEGGRKGVFGLGARPVRIRVRIEAETATSSEATPRAEAPVPAAPPPVAPAASSSPPAEMLSRMLNLMGLDLRLEETARDGSIEIRMDGHDRKRLTARDGELIDALEFVLNRMGRRAWPDAPPVHLVCRGFTSERDGELIEMVREVASRVSRTGKAARLSPMNPYERRIAHVTVREIPGLTTVSEGDGFLKRVRIEKAGS